MTRHRANMAILHALANYLLANPTIRFGQALVNLEIVQVDFIEHNPFRTEKIVTDPHFEEPEYTLERVKQRLDLMQCQQETL